MRPHLRTPLALLASTLLLVFLASCGDDDDGPTNPSTSSGVLVLDVTPDTIDAPWSVVGPASYSTSGTGDTTLEDLEPGSYNVTWQAVDGWNVPSPATETVDVPGGGTKTVTGMYTEIPDEPPVACMDASPATGSVDTEFEFDASCSLDPSGPAGDLEYRWDWEADGTYDYPSNGAYTTDPVATNTFDTTGSKTVRVQVRDSTGNTATVETSVEVTDTPSAPANFVYIPPGTFQMGSPSDPPEPGRDGDETQHPVTLTRGFYMSKYEVTEQWWAEVMGGTPTTSQLPKNLVSWDMAVQFCNELSRREGLTPAYTIHGPNGDVTWNRDANGYRLPTEAEWEYACRAQSTTAFANGPITELDCGDDPNLDAMGWYCGNADGRQNVGQLDANDWDLYDMHGNVWEWVWDGYRADYQKLSSEDPVHDVGAGSFRVMRGGSWGGYARRCRSAGRYVGNPGYTSFDDGFRPVRSAF